MGSIEIFLWESYKDSGNVGAYFMTCRSAEHKMEHQVGEQNEKYVYKHGLLCYKDF